MTTLAQIPFRASFRTAISEGRKTATTRTSRYGWPGDVLSTPFGVSIALTDVYQQTLRWVANHLWEEEGVEGPEAFVAVWKSLHRGSWDDHRTVWVHRFKLSPLALRWHPSRRVSPQLDVVGEREIASRLHVQPNTVHMWRKRGLLPDPEGTVSGQPAWAWETIEAWARSTNRL